VSPSTQMRSCTHEPAPDGPVFFAGAVARPEVEGGLTIVVWIAHHTDRKERVVTQTLTQLRALVVLYADDINAPRRPVDESEPKPIPSEEAIRRLEALLRELHTAVQSEQRGALAVSFLAPHPDGHGVQRGAKA
jgi:hypothetical protein